MGRIESMPRLSRVTGPQSEPITLVEAKAQLLVEHTEQDVFINSTIRGARDVLDGPQGELGRALIEQTWEMKLDCFPAGGERILIPLPPLRSIDQITYVDTQGLTQTLDSSVFQVVGIGTTRRGWIVEAFGKTWPSTRDIADAVTIQFTAGYEPGTGSPIDLAANVPERLKRAMLMLIADWYEFRETAVIGTVSSEIKIARRFEALISPFRVEWF